MDDVVQQRQEKHPKWPYDFAASVWVALKSLFREQALQHILAKSRKKPVEYFQDIVDNVEFDCRLPTNGVVHPTCVKPHQHGAADDDKGTCNDLLAYYPREMFAYSADDLESGTEINSYLGANQPCD
jgi:hypothetical protein